MRLDNVLPAHRYVPYITEPKYDSVIIPTNNYSLAYARTFTEVLAIAYGGNPTVPGVFFPDGEPRLLIPCGSRMVSVHDGSHSMQ